MNKLQSYFDYFEKHYGVETWKWYNSLKKWVEIAQKIKGEISKTDFSVLDDNAKKNKIEQILKESSNDEIKDFFKKYLFEQDNGLGDISRGVIWDTEKNPHKTEIKAKLNDQVLIDLLKQDIQDAEKTIDGLLVGKNYAAAKIRLLRALFPSQIAALDAPNKLDRLLNAIQSKLAIPIVGNYLEKHKKLMKEITGDEYKKQIFFWELYDMLENNLNLKKAIVYYGAPGTGKTFKAKRDANNY